jgi:hypothetical protein
MKKSIVSLSFFCLSFLALYSYPLGRSWLASKEIHFFFLAGHRRKLTLVTLTFATPLLVVEPLKLITPDKKRVSDLNLLLFFF